MAKSKRDADVQDARDNGADGSIRAINAKAKSRATARKRHDSTADYKRFSIDLVDDIYDGLIGDKSARTVLKSDELVERRLERDFRREVFEHMVRTQKLGRGAIRELVG